VPERIRYDNLKAAVAKMLRGRGRIESDRFVALRSHYGFDSFFCQPGVKGAHEKGGVEGEVGRFRRRHPVPVPRVTSMAELNERLMAAAAKDDRRYIASRRITVGEHFALEAEALWPLPAEAFDVAAMITARVDRKARVSVRNCLYSVPARYTARRVDVRVGAETIEALDGAEVVARHGRSLKGDEVLVLDHYLEVLAVKPGALAGATALARARAAGAFGPAHEKFWVTARRRLGDSAGTKALYQGPSPSPGADRRPGGRRDGSGPSGWAGRPGRGGHRSSPGGRGRRCGGGHRGGLVTLRSAQTVDRRLRRPAAGPMTKMTDSAAAAAIGAATRELRLRVVRADAARLAEIASRSQQSYLVFLAEILSAEVDARSERRRVGASARPASRASSAWPITTPTPPHRSPRPLSPPSPREATWTPASQWSCSATPVVVDTALSFGCG
jgi:hypothetical protein